MWDDSYLNLKVIDAVEHKLKLSHEILHIYATNRTEKMKMDQNTLVTDPAKRQALRKNIPETF